MKKGIFGINNIVDLFRKLENDFESMHREPENQSAAINFFVTAESMVDWLYPGKKNKQKREDFHNREVLLQVTSHLAIWAKHFKVEAKHHTSVDETAQTGYFAPGYFSKGYFNFPECWIVQLKDDAANKLGNSIRAIDLAKRVLDFWRDHLNIV
jgi:hypothetical protein